MYPENTSVLLDVLFYVVKCVHRIQNSETLQRILNMNSARSAGLNTRFITEQISNSMPTERVKISKILLIFLLLTMMMNMYNQDRLIKKIIIGSFSTSPTSYDVASYKKILHPNSKKYFYQFQYL